MAFPDIQTQKLLFLLQTECHSQYVQRILSFIQFILTIKKLLHLLEYKYKWSTLTSVMFELLSRSKKSRKWN